MAKKAKTKNPSDAVAEDFGDAIDLINKSFGDGSIFVGGSGSIKVDTFPSGIPSVDVALGCRGIPQGRIIELYGAESSGKTTVCLQIIASCQSYYFPKKERYGRVAFIDAEHALDVDWATKIGVNIDKMAIAQPDSGEQAFNIIETLIKTDKVDLIVVDSVAALTPQVELDGELADSHIGVQARLMSKGLRKLKGVASRHKTTVIFINQTREKIGVTFGNPETTPGGKALKFYASIRGNIFKGSALKDGDTVIGFRPKIKFIKNKVGRPFTEAHFDICVGTDKRPIYGVDRLASLIDVGASPDIGVIARSGNFYKYGDLNLGNGVTNAIAFLRDNPETIAKLENEIYDVAFGTSIDVGPESVDDLLIMEEE